MYVLRALRSEASLKAALDRLVASGSLQKRDGDAGRITAMLANYGISSLPEAALRFCRHELDPDVMLCGTGSTVHLDAAIAAVQAGPLPEAAASELRRTFAMH